MRWKRGTVHLQDGIASMQGSSWADSWLTTSANISHGNFISQIFKSKVDSETSQGFFLPHLTLNWCWQQRMIWIHSPKSHKNWKGQKRNILEGICVLNSFFLGWTLYFIGPCVLWEVHRNRSVEWYNISPVTYFSLKVVTLFLLFFYKALLYLGNLLQCILIISPTLSQLLQDQPLLDCPPKFVPSFLTIKYNSCCHVLLSMGPPTWNIVNLPCGL